MSFDLLRTEFFLRDGIIGSRAHRHNYYMVMLVTKGKGSQLIDFKSYPVEPGMLFTMYPGQIHAWEWQQEITGYILFFTPDFFNLRYHNNQLTEFPFFQHQAPSPFVRINPESQPYRDLILLFETMLAEYQHPALDQEKALRSYLNILLIHCHRLYQQQFVDLSPEETQAGQLIKQFVALIGEHFAQKHQVKDYAEQLRISPNYLNSLSTKVTGKHAGVLIRDRIMLEAKRMLLHETLTIAQIGHQLGFEDNSYFSRFFRKYSGMTPEAFRKQYHYPLLPRY